MDYNTGVGTDMERREPKVESYFKRRQGKMDEKFEEILEKDLEMLASRAKDLGILPDDVSSQPVQLMTPDQFLDDNISYRLNKDEDDTVLRYSQAAVTTLFYDDTRLYYHQCNLDVVSGKVYEDVVGEFKLDDVVTVETFLTFDGEDDPGYARLDVEIQLSNGSELVFIVRRHPLTKNYSEENLLSTKEKTFLTLLKNLVRK